MEKVCTPQHQNINGREIIIREKPATPRMSHADTRKFYLTLIAF